MSERLPSYFITKLRYTDFTSQGAILHNTGSIFIQAITIVNESTMGMSAGMGFKFFDDKNA